MPVVAKERLYLTADRKRCVGHNDREAAILFAGAGQSLSNHDAARFGITDGRVPGKSKAPTEDKAADKAEDKEVTKTDDKGRGGLTVKAEGARLSTRG